MQQPDDYDPEVNVAALYGKPSHWDRTTAKIIGAIVTVVILWFVILVVVFAKPSHTTPAEQWRLVQPGMSSVRVVGLMGPPTVTDRNGTQTWQDGSVEYDAFYLTPTGLVSSLLDIHSRP